MELKSILESLLFTSQKPLSPAELRDVLKKAASEASGAAVEEGEPSGGSDAVSDAVSDAGADAGAGTWGAVGVSEIEAALGELAGVHEAAGRSYRLVCVAGAWQFVTLPAYAPWLRAFVGVKNRPTRLSQPALETLAIIAYRQPITRAEMEQIRGVAVDGVVASLKERGLIEEAGRAAVVGRPIQYGTTPAFLEYFGLASLEDLPAADELRRIPVQRPASIPTLDDDPVAPPTDAGGGVSAGVEVTGGSGAPDVAVAPDAGASRPEGMDGVLSEGKAG